MPGAGWVHTPRVAPRLIAVVLGLWGVALTAGLLTHSFPATLFERAPEQVGAERAGGGTSAETGGDERAQDGASTLPGEPADDALLTMTPRYQVCDSAHGGARMALHNLGGAQLLAVHCGGRVVWLGLHAGKHGSQPQLEASLQLTPRTDGSEGKPLLPAAADLDGDGRPELIAPFLHVDASGTPLEGGVAVLSRPRNAGLGAPRRLFGGHPLSIVHGRFDGKAVALGLLGPSNARVAGEHSLWLLSAEPAPTKTVTLPAGDADTAVALDLNLDGRDDIVMGGARRSAAWWLSGDEAGAHGHALGPVRETHAGDLSGDGKPDALIVGDGLWVLQASKEGAFAPKAIESTQCKGVTCMRDVQLTDLDGDGKLDIVGYVHPAIRWLRNLGGHRYESRPLSRIEGDAMSILQALVTDADSDGLIDLVLLGHVKESPSAIELAIVDNIRSHEVIRLGGDPLPTPQSALAATFALR